MKRLISLAILLTGMMGAAWADMVAVDQAGQQRMLTQRMVKSYAQISLDILAADAGWQLAGAVERFEYNLSWLERTTTTRKARGALAELRSAWPALKRATKAEVTPQGLRELDKRAAQAQYLADQLTLILQNESSDPNAKVINLSARQRMLGQRMVKAYMLRLAGLDSPALRDEMERAKHDFDTALDALILREENSPVIADKLQELALQWEWLHSALDTDGADNFGLLIAESGETVLRLCEDIVQVYQSEFSGRR